MTFNHAIRSWHTIMPYNHDIQSWHTICNTRNNTPLCLLFIQLTGINGGVSIGSNWRVQESLMCHFVSCSYNTTLTLHLCLHFGYHVWCVTQITHAWIWLLHWDVRYRQYRWREYAGAYCNIWVHSQIIFQIPLYSTGDLYNLGLIHLGCRIIQSIWWYIMFSTLICQCYIENVLHLHKCTFPMCQHDLHA